MSDDNNTAMIARADAADISLSGLLYLYQITLSDGSIARLFPAASSDMVAVFDGQSYHAHPIETDGFSWSAYQPAQQAILRLSHHGLPDDFKPNFDNVRGGEVRLIITFAAECAPPVGNDGGASFPPEIWHIDQLETGDEMMVQFTLQPAANLQSEMLPKRVVLRDVCQHSYRQWDAALRVFDYSHATCPYVGSDYFTSGGAPTTNQAQDSCSLRLESGCKKRYIDALPFYGFPGLSR